MPSRVTIKSIANTLGISHMTVSRALSNHPNVQADTRHAIQKLADDLGYVRSSAALAMRGNSARIVGLLLPNIVNEFYARIANAMADECATRALQLIIHLTHDDKATETQALQRLQEVQAQAVVMVPAPGSPTSRFIGNPNLNCIELVRQDDDMTGNSAVLVEDAPAIRHAIRHLVRRGHRDIGFIGASASLSSGRERLQAFEAALAEVNLMPRRELMRLGAPTFESGQRSARAFLTRGKTTAIVAGGFAISNGAISALMAAPDREVAFVGYGDPPFYQWLNGGISTIQVPVADMAAKAVELADGENPPSQPQTHRFSARFISRDEAHLGNAPS